MFSSGIHLVAKVHFPSFHNNHPHMNKLTFTQHKLSTRKISRNTRAYVTSPISVQHN